MREIITSRDTLYGDYMRPYFRVVAQTRREDRLLYDKGQLTEEEFRQRLVFNRHIVDAVRTSATPAEASVKVLQIIKSV